MDDASVTKVSLNTVMSQSAYLLFYQKNPTTRNSNNVNSEQLSFHKDNGDSKKKLEKKKSDPLAEILSINANQASSKLPSTPSSKPPLSNNSFPSQATPVNPTVKPAPINSTIKWKATPILERRSVEKTINSTISFTQTPLSTKAQNFLDELSIEAKVPPPIATQAEESKAVRNEAISVLQKQISSIKEKRFKQKVVPEQIINHTDVRPTFSFESAVLNQTSDLKTWGHVDQRILSERSIEMVKRKRADREDMEYDAPKPRKIKNKKSFFK